MVDQYTDDLLETRYVKSNLDLDGDIEPEAGTPDPHGGSRKSGLQKHMTSRIKGLVKANIGRRSTKRSPRQPSDSKDKEEPANILPTISMLTVQVGSRIKGKVRQEEMKLDARINQMRKRVITKEQNMR